MSTDVETSKTDPVPNEDGRGNGGSGWLSGLKARLGLPTAQTLRETLEDGLRGDAKSDDNISTEERGMLLRMLRFGQLRVDDVMVPRADIIALEESETLAEVLSTFQEAGVSRIPVFHETLDDLRGMIHFKDMTRWLLGEASGRPFSGTKSETEAAPAGSNGDGTGEETVSSFANLDLSRVDLSRPMTVAKIRRPVLYVPPSMPAMNLLLRMQSTRIHMAFVIDEYGGTDGLVTIEDLVEQIVGDIEDEHDETEEDNIIDDPKLGLVASARTPVKELEARLGVKLLEPEEEEEIDTLGGLVFALVGRVPARGELVRHRCGIEFEVLDADPRRINKLKVHTDRIDPVSAASEPATDG
jgi:CBS domain containing-hemolysin-like protein